MTLAMRGWVPLRAYTPVSRRRIALLYDDEDADTVHTVNTEFFDFALVAPSHSSNSNNTRSEAEVGVFGGVAKAESNVD